jgi:SH3 domain
MSDQKVSVSKLRELFETKSKENGVSFKIVKRSWNNPQRKTTAYSILAPGYQPSGRSSAYKPMAKPACFGRSGFDGAGVEIHDSSTVSSAPRIINPAAAAAIARDNAANAADDTAADDTTADAPPVAVAVADSKHEAVKSRVKTTRATRTSVFGGQAVPIVTAGSHGPEDEIADADVDTNADVQPQPDDSTGDVPFLARVLYDYVAVEESELTIIGGDLVQVLELNNAGWALGYTVSENGDPRDDKHAWFPLDYVEPETGSAAAAAAAAVSSAAPEQKSRPEMPDQNLVTDREAVLAFLSGSSLFNTVRAEREIEVTTADIDNLVTEGKSVTGAVAYMLHLDKRSERFESFSDLAAGIAKTRGEFDTAKAEFKTYASSSSVPLCTAGLSDSDISSLFEEGGAGLDTLRLFKTFEVEASLSSCASLEEAIANLQLLSSRDHSADVRVRGEVIDWLGSSECKLFKDKYISFTDSDLMNLYADGRTGPQVMDAVKKLNESGVQFGSFGELVAAVDAATGGSGRIVAEAKKPQGQEEFQQIMQFLTSTDCTVFTGTLRVSMQDIKKLMELCGGTPAGVIGDVRTLSQLGVKCGGFEDLFDAHSGAEFAEFKGQIKQYLSDAESSLFTDASIATAVQDCDVDTIIRVGQSGIFTAPICHALVSQSGGSGVAANVSELATKINGARQTVQDRIETEKNAVLEFLGGAGLFTADVQVLLKDLEDLVRGVLFTPYGVNGGTVADVLKELQANPEKRFASFPDMNAAAFAQVPQMANAQ